MVFIKTSQSYIRHHGRLLYNVGASMDFYPGNTISSFKNKFGEPVRVEED
jgi:hypothetical protein